MPLARKIPKRGFNNAQFRLESLSVNIGVVANHFEAGETVDRCALVSKGLVPDRKGLVKILGGGEAPKALVIKGIAVSATAKAKIEAAGGSVA